MNEKEKRAIFEEAYKELRAPNILVMDDDMMAEEADNIRTATQGFLTFIVATVHKFLDSRGKDEEEAVTASIRLATMYFRAGMWLGAKLAIERGLSMNDLHDKYTVEKDAQDE